MPTDAISLDLLGRQQEAILKELALIREELKSNRHDNRGIRQAFTGISEHFSRQERRLGELKYDLETMIKLEIGGANANSATGIENRLDKQTQALHQMIRQAVLDITATVNNT